RIDPYGAITLSRTSRLSARSATPKALYWYSPSAPTSANADSDTPQGVPPTRAFALWASAAFVQASWSSVQRGIFVRRGGMRYSKAVPLQDSRVRRPPTPVYGRDRCTQWLAGTSCSAIATMLSRRDSDASRSYAGSSS